MIYKQEECRRRPLWSVGVSVLQREGWRKVSVEHDRSRTQHLQHCFLHFSAFFHHWRVHHMLRDVHRYRGNCETPNVLGRNHIHHAWPLTYVFVSKSQVAKVLPAETFYLLHHHSWRLRSHQNHDSDCPPYVSSSQRWCSTDHEVSSLLQDIGSFQIRQAVKHERRQVRSVIKADAWYLITWNMIGLWLTSFHISEHVFTTCLFCISARNAEYGLSFKIRDDNNVQY